MVPLVASYQVFVCSQSGAVIRAFMATSEELSRLTAKVRDGEGLIHLPENDDENYKLIPARSVGWLDVTKVSD